MLQVYERLEMKRGNCIGATTNKKRTIEDN